MSNQDLQQQAQAVMPGGVNSPVRAFNAVGGAPVFVERAEGAYVYDTAGKQYIDFVGAYGPAIVGHAHPKVVEAIKAAAEKGLCFGATHANEITLSEKIIALMPQLEQVRLVNSGTEAAATALRLARGVTGRSKIIKFVGGYHGHVDSLLVQAGSGAATFGAPSSAGVPPAVVQDTLLADYNDLEAVANLFTEHGDDIAAVMIEPVAGNMGMVPPVEGFLQGLRDLCTQHNSLLILDEVMTCFRIALGGAYEEVGVEADITMLGKVIGGGMPIGAVAGRRVVMEQLSPLGPVYQAGTLSGCPIAVAAGIATLDLISQPGFFEELSNKTQTLVDGINSAAQSASVTYRAQSIGGMWGGFFAESVTNFAQAAACSKEQFNHFFHSVLDQGIFLAPSHFEAAFMSIAHSGADITHTIQAFAQAFGRIKGGLSD